MINLLNYVHTHTHTDIRNIHTVLKKMYKDSTMYCTQIQCHTYILYLTGKSPSFFQWKKCLWREFFQWKKFLRSTHRGWERSLLSTSISLNTRDLLRIQKQTTRYLSFLSIRFSENRITCIILSNILKKRTPGTSWIP